MSWKSPSCSLSCPRAALTQSTCNPSCYLQAHSDTCLVLCIFIFPSCLSFSQQPIQLLNSTCKLPYQPSLSPVCKLDFLPLLFHAVCPFALLPLLFYACCVQQGLMFVRHELFLPIGIEPYFIMSSTFMSN